MCVVAESAGQARSTLFLRLRELSSRACHVMCEDLAWQKTSAGRKSRCSSPGEFGRRAPARA
eukprot:scaffold10136_cov126-Isochrysis_galbana.AAC.11